MAVCPKSWIICFSICLTLAGSLYADPLAEPGRFIPPLEAKPLIPPFASEELNEAKRKAKPNAQTCTNCAEGARTVITADQSAAQAGVAVMGLSNSYLDLHQRMQFQQSMWDLNRSVKKIADDVRMGRIPASQVPQIQRQLATTFREQSGANAPDTSRTIASNNSYDYPVRGNIQSAGVSQVVAPVTPKVETPIDESKSFQVPSIVQQVDKPILEREAKPVTRIHVETNNKALQPVAVISTMKGTPVATGRDASHPVPIYSQPNPEKRKEKREKKGGQDSSETTREPSTQEWEENEGQPSSDNQEEILDLEETAPAVARDPRSFQSMGGEVAVSPESLTEKGWLKPIHISRSRSGSEEVWTLHPILLLILLICVYLIGSHTKRTQRAVVRRRRDEEETNPEIRLN